MTRSRAAALALALLLPSLAASQEAEWPRSLWDPAGAAAGQLDLPLPCGGRMAFLRVKTPVEPGDPLADREVRIGGAEPSTGYLDHFRRDWIRGGFGDGAEAHYLIGKYEVTRDQWAAVTGDCPEPSRGGMRPQGGLSWFDAIDFTRRLSEWLATEAPEALPEREGVRGHLRLPTEVEWEYAARGGAAVDEADFRGALPPMDGPLTDYAWFEGRSSANGAYRPVGMHEPNPLGLHGLFGGVEEIALEPFAVNSLGRDHGQIGGFVTRGGSIQTPGPELRSALRAERPFFSAADGKATAFDSFGLRPVISAPVNTSLATTTLLRDLWIERSSAAPEATADPLAALDALSESQTDRRVLNELALIRGEIVGDRQAREAAMLKSDRVTILSGAVVMKWIGQLRTSVRRLAEVQDILREGAEDAASDSLRETYQAKLSETAAKAEVEQVNLDLAASVYLSALLDLADRRSKEALREQAAVLVLELQDRGQGELATGVDRFVRNVERRIEDPAMTREEMIEDTL